MQLQKKLYCMLFPLLKRLNSAVFSILSRNKARFDGKKEWQHCCIHRQAAHTHTHTRSVDTHEEGEHTEKEIH